MKASECKAYSAPIVETNDKPKYPKSACADPAITDAEASEAPVTICRRHGGLVRVFAAKEGSVHFCPTGNEYWRHTARKHLWRGLKYSKNVVI